MPQLAHPLCQVLRQRFFATEKVGGAGDVDPHRVGSGERHRGAVAERDLSQPPSARSTSTRLTLATTS